MVGGRLVTGGQMLRGGGLEDYVRVSDIILQHLGLNK